MTPWIEDTTLRRRYDDKQPWEKGRRSKAWGGNGEPAGWYWEVKEGSKRLADGEAKSRAAAVVAVGRVVAKLGWGGGG